MKKMKKVLAGLLAATMVMSMSVTAWAEEATYSDMREVTIDKTYTVTNADTSYPDETFEFTIERTNLSDSGDGVTVANMPLPTLNTVSFATTDGTATKNLTVTLPEYTSVGIYTYTIKETAGSTAGVIYYPDDIKLVVTVIQGDDGVIRVAAVHTEKSGSAKSNDIENVYNAGSLSISKTVTGILGDKEKYFKVTVTLNGDGVSDYSDNVITVERGSYADNPTSVKVGEEYEFYLKDGDTITLGNIPYGVTYDVVEADYTGEDYDDAAYTFSDGENKKIDSVKDTVAIVNNKDGNVDTGIILDSAPYILLLALAAMGVFAVVNKKREEEF